MPPTDQSSPEGPVRYLIVRDLEDSDTHTCRCLLSRTLRLDVDISTTTLSRVEQHLLFFFCDLVSIDVLY